jgi:uncharacterized protein YutE (UPF0331/DUF86 family)
MIDKDILVSKADRVHHHVKRIKEKRPASLEEFLSQVDFQEINLFNLQMAIQHCIDMASHVISDEGLGMPGSTNEMFYVLQVIGYIPHEVTEKMVAGLGFRNLLFHEYAKAAVDLHRCIGCGLCVTTCPTEALRLDAKSQKERKAPPCLPKGDHDSAGQGEAQIAHSPRIARVRLIRFSLNSKIPGAQLTASLRSLPGVNFGTFFASILISLPVCGFLPVLAFLLLTLNVPNPTSETVSFSLSALVMLSRTHSTASCAAFFVPTTFANSLTRSPLFIFLLLFS